MRKAHASVQQMPIGVQRGLFDAEGVFPAAAIAFAGTSDAAVVFRPSAFRSRGSWTFATVPPATLPQDDLALLRSMFLAPVVFEMCCRHDSTQICGANSILRLSRQSICHSAAEVVSETPTIGRSWSKSLEPEWHARPSPYFATFASTACRKRHPVSDKRHSPAEMRFSPASGTPYFTRFDACVTPGAGDDSLSRLAYRSNQPQTWESEFTERDEDGFDG